MTVPVPAAPKLYHILHISRLRSVVEAGALWSDAQVRSRSIPGTSIGMAAVKKLRLTKALNSRPALRVGDCVPFYFCPRSVRLYVLHMANHPKN